MTPSSRARTADSQLANVSFDGYWSHQKIYRGMMKRLPYATLTRTLVGSNPTASAKILFLFYQNKNDAMYDNHRKKIVTIL